MRKSVGGHKRDANEKPIADALRKVGAQVEYCSGERAPDLLVCWHGRWMPLEVKTAKGRKTDSQKETNYPVVHTVQEAFAACGIYTTLEQWA